MKGSGRPKEKGCTCSITALSGPSRRIMALSHPRENLCLVAAPFAFVDTSRRGTGSSHSCVSIKII